MLQAEVKSVFVCLHKRCSLVATVSKLAPFICVENYFLSLSDINEMKVEMSCCVILFSDHWGEIIISAIRSVQTEDLIGFFLLLLCVVSISWHAVSQLLRWKVWMLYVYFLWKKCKKNLVPSKSSYFYNTIVTDLNKQFGLARTLGLQDYYTGPVPIETFQ